MAVLIFLIILDLVMMAVVLYFVIREPQHRQPAYHPFLAEAAQGASLSASESPEAASASSASNDAAPAQPPQAEAK